MNEARGYLYPYIKQFSFLFPAPDNIELFLAVDLSIIGIIGKAPIRANLFEAA